MMTTAQIEPPVFACHIPDRIESGSWCIRSVRPPPRARTFAFNPPHLKTRLPLFFFSFIHLQCVQRMCSLAAAFRTCDDSHVPHEMVYTSQSLPCGMMCEQWTNQGGSRPPNACGRTDGRQSVGFGIARGIVSMKHDELSSSSCLVWC